MHLSKSFTASFAASTPSSSAALELPSYGHTRPEHDIIYLGDCIFLSTLLQKFLILSTDDLVVLLNKIISSENMHGAFHFSWPFGNEGILICFSSTSLVCPPDTISVTSMKRREGRSRRRSPLLPLNVLSSILFLYVLPMMHSRHPSIPRRGKLTAYRYHIHSTSTEPHFHHSILSYALISQV